MNTLKRLKSFYTGNQHSTKTQVTISYQIAGEGKMLVNMHYYGQKGLPELPALGLRFIMPTKAKFLSMKAYQGNISGSDGWWCRRYL